MVLNTGPLDVGWSCSSRGSCSALLTSLHHHQDQGYSSQEVYIFYLTLVALVTDSPPLQFTMTVTKTPKDPPHLSCCNNYEDWCKMVSAWTKLTDLDPERQGASFLKVSLA